MSAAQNDDDDRVALGVPCPASTCTAGAGERCVKPDGEPARQTHKTRVKAARKAAQNAAQRAEREVPESIKGTRWRRLYRNARLELEQRGDWTKLAEAELESMVRAMASAERALEAAEA
ncbi:MAG: hypothetical protein LC708_00930, partial [Actinobacteria bacterium]|nr:hypothetical protein [Actinomycetota bacterium]